MMVHHPGTRQEIEIPGHCRLAYECHDPIRFPGFPGIERIRLLPARGSGRDVRPDEPGPRWLAIHQAIGIEGTDAVIETTHDRRVERSQWITAVDPPDRPPPHLRVVCPNRSTIRPAARLVEDVLLHVCAPAQERALAGRSVEFQPGLARVGAPDPVMNPKVAKKKIKPVRANSGGIGSIGGALGLPQRG